MKNLIKHVVSKLKENNKAEWNTFNIPSDYEVNDCILNSFLNDGYDLENDDHEEILMSYKDDAYDALCQEIISSGGEVIVSSPNEDFIAKELEKTNLTARFLERFEFAFKF